jgi:hypothetical protein
MSISLGLYTTPLGVLNFTYPRNRILIGSEIQCELMACLKILGLEWCLGWFYVANSWIGVN